MNSQSRQPWMRGNCSWPRKRIAWWHWIRALRPKWRAFVGSKTIIEIWERKGAKGIYLSVGRPLPLRRSPPRRCAPRSGHSSRYRLESGRVYRVCNRCRYSSVIARGRLGGTGETIGCLAGFIDSAQTWGRDSPTCEQDGTLYPEHGRFREGRVEENAWPCGFGLLFLMGLYEKASESAQWRTSFALHGVRPISV